MWTFPKLKPDPNLPKCPECGEHLIWHNNTPGEYYSLKCGAVLDMNMKVLNAEPAGIVTPREC